MTEKVNGFSVRSRVIFAGVLVGGLGVAVFGWAATAELTSAVIAPGTVIVENKPQEVAHRDGGVVAAIYVRDGQRVDAGQPLIELDPTQIQAEIGVIRAELVDLVGRSARLRAIALDQEAIEFPEGFTEMNADAATVQSAEVAFFESQRLYADSRKQQLGLQIEQLQEEIGGLEAQKEALKEQLGFIQLELEQVRKLYEKGLTTIERVYALERESARLTGELNGVFAQIARATGRISEITVEIANVDQTARLEAREQLSTALARISELRQRELAAEDRLKRTTLQAPQGGIVFDMRVNTIGGVVTPAEPVLMIVPDEERLTVEARLQPADREQVAVGGDVTLRFSALNKQRSPELPGRVLQISADISQDERTGEPYYLARVEIDEPALAENEEIDLIPGMPVEVYVTSAPRTALSYFTKPFLDYFERAFREW